MNGKPQHPTGNAVTTDSGNKLARTVSVALSSVQKPVSGRLQQLRDAGKTPPPPSLAGNTAADTTASALSVHSGTKGSKTGIQGSWIDIKIGDTGRPDKAISGGSAKVDINVRSACECKGQCGCKLSLQRYEGPVNQIKKLLAVKIVGHEQILAQVKEALLKKSHDWSRMNVYVKVYRFCSDDRDFSPWSLYSAQHCRAVPLGRSNAGGVGWTDTGTFYAAVPAVVDLAIPLQSSASTQVISRTGPAIFIKQVHGGWRVIRRGLTYLGNMGSAANGQMPQRSPHVVSYLQRTPISLTISSYPYSLGFCCSYPGVVTTIPDGYQAYDFIFYSDNLGSAPPTPITGAAAADNWVSLNDYSGAYWRMHRIPTPMTEVYSLYSKTHHCRPMDASWVNTAVPVNFDTGINIWAMDAVPKTEIYDIGVKHTFHGRGLEQVYGQGNPTGSALINRLQALYWQDTTGTLCRIAVGNDTPMTECYQSGYQETIEYEFFVEFEDAPTQEDA